MLLCLAEKEAAAQGLTQKAEQLKEAARKLEAKKKANGGELSQEESEVLNNLTQDMADISTDTNMLQVDYVRLQFEADPASLGAVDKKRKELIDQAMKYSHVVWHRLISNFDAGDLDAELDFEELIRVWAYVNGYLPEIEQAEISFQLLDVDGSGFISKGDMMKTLQWRQSLGLVNIPNIEEFVGDVFLTFDKNNDSVMSMLEFCEYLEIWRSAATGVRARCCRPPGRKSDREFLYCDAVRCRAMPCDVVRCRAMPCDAVRCRETPLLP